MQAPRDVLSRVGGPLSVAAVVATALLLSTASLAQTAPAMHDADPADPGDLAILRAHGNTVAGRVIRNSCDGVVRPRIALVTPNVAVVTEMDPTGSCSGSNPPGSLGVLVRSGVGWRPSTSTIGSAFTLGAANGGHPDIMVQYAPFQRNCPLLRWDGRDYRMARACPGGRG
ncbi:MAG: hypothetical protein ACRYHQ_11840 [Janthinobacterium lividum]